MAVPRKLEFRAKTATVEGGVATQTGGSGRFLRGSGLWAETRQMSGGLAKRRREAEHVPGEGRASALAQGNRMNARGLGEEPWPR